MTATSCTGPLREQTRKLVRCQASHVSSKRLNINNEVERSDAGGQFPREFRCFQSMPGTPTYPPRSHRRRAAQLPGAPWSGVADGFEDAPARKRVCFFVSSKVSPTEERERAVFSGWPGKLKVKQRKYVAG